MNEAETRAEHIDPALKAAGWGVVEGSRIRREYPITLGRIEGHGRRGKALTADYVLEYRNTKLAVNEAKAWDEQLTEGVAQAKNYASKLAVRYAYSTNGRGIYQVDMSPPSHSSHPPEGEVARYPTPDEALARFALKLDRAVREQAPAGWRGDHAREAKVKNAIYPLLDRDKDATVAVFDIVKNQPGY